MNRSWYSMLHAGVALGLLSAAPAARAADVTPAQAAALEGQVRDWLKAQLGATVTLPDGLAKFTAAGDHYDVSVPLVGLMLKSGPEIRMTAQLRPLDGGKWKLDAFTVPSPLDFTLEVPMPSPADPKAPPVMTPMHYTVNMTGHVAQILWDPSFASASSFQSNVQSLNVVSEGGPMSSRISAGPSRSKSTLAPIDADRVNFETSSELTDYKVSTQGAAPVPFEIGMQRVGFAAALNGVSRSRAAAIVQTASALALAAMDAQKAGTVPAKPTPEQTHVILDALGDFASEFKFDESIDDLTVKAAGQAMELEHMKLGFGVKAANGILQAAMDVNLAGLTLPGMALGDLEDLIPEKVAFQPSVSGIGVPEIKRMLTALGEGKDVSPDDIEALFSHGGIKAGMDMLTIEVADAVLSAQGGVVMTSPSAVAGHAHIVADNFDAMMKKISGIPQAAQAMPVLALVKGMGKAVNNQIVWDVVYQDSKILVNGVDLSAMTGGGAPKGPAPQRPAPNKPR